MHVHNSKSDAWHEHLQYVWIRIITVNVRLLLGSCASIISIICFIVHYQLIFHKVETIGLRFIWMIDQLLH